jgi:hypothetical protein
VKFELIKRRVDSAIEILRIKDFYLLKNNASERSITHKFAEHLQYVIGNSYNVDCEYNRNVDELNNHKKLHILRSKISEIGREFSGEHYIGKSNDEEYCNLSVYPDIIVHKRGNNNNNLLAIEVKKSASNINEKYDFFKLESYTENSGVNGLAYEYGIFVKFFTGENKYKSPVMKWFMDGKSID